MTRKIESMKTQSKSKKAALAASSGSQPLVVLPIGTDEKTLSLVRKAGYVPILTDAPDKVKVILPGASIASESDLLMAAMYGLTGAYDRDMAVFVKELYRRMKAREVENTVLSESSSHNREANPPS